METELFKLLLAGGFSTAFAGVLIWIVVKLMPSQQAQFLASQERQQVAFLASQDKFIMALEKQRLESMTMLERERGEFLGALKNEREKFYEDREKDREVRHYLGNVVNSLALNLAQAGVKFTIEPPLSETNPKAA